MSVSPLAPTRTHGRTVGVAVSVGAFLVASGACGEASAPGSADVVRSDSAGIEVVETRRASWSAGGGWRLPAEPELVIGRIEGEAPYLFGEVSGAIRLDDGTVAVADDQAREVRFFDPAGRFVRAVGGPGEGPSEFPRGVYSLERCGAERIYARDLFARRVLSFAPDGTFQRSFPLMEPGNPTRPPYGATCTDGGGFVAVGWATGEDYSMPDLAAGREAVMYRQDAPVWVLDSLTSVETELGTFLSSERIRVRGGSGPHPLGRAVRFAAAGGRVYLGTGEAFAVRVYVNGELFRIQRSVTEDLTFDEAAVEAYLAADLSEEEAQDRRMVEQAEGAMPPALPAYVGMRATPGGYLWVERFVMPPETAHRWGVFAPDGTFLGNLELPPELRITEIGDDHVVGVATDELGVQRVHVYRLGR